LLVTARRVLLLNVVSESGVVIAVLMVEQRGEPPFRVMTQRAFRWSQGQGA